MEIQNAYRLTATCFHEINDSVGRNDGKPRPLAVLNAENFIPRHNGRGVCRRTGHDISNNEPGCLSGGYHIYRLRHSNMKCNGKQRPRHNHICGNTSDENDRLLPSWRIHKTSTSMLVLPLIAKKSHETAKRDPVECVLRIPYFPEGKRPRRIPHAEFFYSYPEYLGCNKMSQLMRDDEENEYRDHQ